MRSAAYLLFLFFAIQPSCAQIPETCEPVSRETIMPKQHSRLDTAHMGEITLIAHAAGAYKGNTYTNSVEAATENYNRNGFRLFEIDMHWTQDDKLVMIHDWGRTFRKQFPGWELSRKPTYREFINLQMKDDQHQLDLDSLVSWLKGHPDAYIVTDVKSRNLEALKLISDTYPLLKNRFIPQIYAFEEYDAVEALGYRHIILTLYRTNASDAEVVAFSKNNALYGVTASNVRLNKGSLVADLNQLGQKVFVFTINNRLEFFGFYRKGVVGVYTDDLSRDAVDFWADAQYIKLGAVKSGMEPFSDFEVSVEGYDRIGLLAGDGGDKISSDHANWCDVAFHTKDGSKISLSSLEPISVFQQWGKYSVDKSVTNRNLQIGQYACQNGIGTHANSEIVFRIPINTASISGKVGIDANIGANGSVDFGLILKKTGALNRIWMKFYGSMRRLYLMGQYWNCLHLRRIGLYCPVNPL